MPGRVRYRISGYNFSDRYTPGQPGLEKPHDGFPVKIARPTGTSSTSTSIPFLIFPCRHAVTSFTAGQRKVRKKGAKGKAGWGLASLRVAEFKRLLKPLPCIQDHRGAFRYSAHAANARWCCLTIVVCIHVRGTWSHCFSIRVYRWSVGVGRNRLQFRPLRTKKRFARFSLSRFGTRRRDISTLSCAEFRGNEKDGNFLSFY